MYRRNFLFHQSAGGCFAAGQPFKVEVPRPGKYKVTVALRTDAPLKKVSILTDSGNLAFVGEIPIGVSKHITVVNVGNTVPAGQSRICQDRAFTVTVAAERNCFSGLSVSEITCPTIYIAGTSPADCIWPGDCCRDSGADCPDPGDCCRDSGADCTAPGDCCRNSASACTELGDSCRNSNGPHEWARMLPAYTNPNIAVSNHSRPGITLKSFRKKGLYAAMCEYVRPGDFFFLCFDPIGQNVEDWNPGGFYRRLLARYIIECRERLIYPVLFTPAACQNNIDDPNSQLWHQCVDAYSEVGKVTATPVIEVHKISVIPCDAYVMAGLVAGEISRVCGAYPGRNYRLLAKCLGPKPLTVSPTATPKQGPTDGTPYCRSPKQSASDSTPYCRSTKQGPTVGCHKMQPSIIT